MTGWTIFVAGASVGRDENLSCTVPGVLLVRYAAMLMLVVTTAGPAGAESPESPRRAASAPIGRASRSKPAIREGTRLKDVTGRFRLSGDRVTFRPDSKDERELVVLENLLLDRITSADDFNSKRTWLVSGIVTQYRGTNYLLLTRAVARSDASRSRRRAKRSPSSKESSDESRAAQRS